MQTQPARRRARVPLLLSLAALLLLAVLATRGGSAVPRGTGVTILGKIAPRPITRPPANPHVPNPAVSIGLSTTFLFALVFFLLALVGFLILLASLRWFRVRRTRLRAGGRGERVGDVEGDMVEALLQGTRSALLTLRQRAGGPPGDAVQEAWLALESAGAECGTTRRPDQTPTEFTTAVLAAHAVDEPALATLRGLYQRARFGTRDTVTEADADTAIDALDRIAETLRATVAGAR